MNRIGEKRKELGMTQGQLAEILRQTDPRIDNAMVCRFERGICVPNKDVLESLEIALGAFAKDLYPEEGNFPTREFIPPKKPYLDLCSAIKSLTIIQDEVNMMFSQLLDHPDILATIRTGYPEPQKEWPSCPECGEEAEYFYRDISGHVVGCSSCLQAVSADIMREEEEEEAYLQSFASAD